MHRLIILTTCLASYSNVTIAQTTNLTVFASGTLPDSGQQFVTYRLWVDPGDEHEWSIASMEATIQGATYFQSCDNDGNPLDPNMFGTYPDSAFTSYYTVVASYPNTLESSINAAILPGSPVETDTHLFCEWLTWSPCAGAGVIAQFTIIPDSPNWSGTVMGVIYTLDYEGGPYPYSLAFDSNDYADCNLNGIPDEWDITSGSSYDCNDNSIPDECESDCNCNHVHDDLDILYGDSADCNGNGIPDDCADLEVDCNVNGIPDECDVDPSDPDGNGVIHSDCNGNGIPDDCTELEGDCNENGVPDDCDVDPNDPDGNGEVDYDCNSNRIPDECDIADGSSQDRDNDGIPDECPPIPIRLDYTATAWADNAGAQVVDNGPAYVTRTWGGTETPNHTTVSASAVLDYAGGGCTRGVIELAGSDGDYCCVWHEEFCEGVCVSDCGDTSGTISGTMEFGASAIFPYGTVVRLDLALQAYGDTAEYEDYHYRIWSNSELLVDMNPDTPDTMTCLLLAGSELTYEMHVYEQDAIGQGGYEGPYSEYDRTFEFMYRMVPLSTSVLLVCDKQNDQILAYDGLSGEQVSVVADASSGISYPNDVVYDREHNLYISSVESQSVIKLSALSGEPVMEYAEVQGPVGLLINEPYTLLISSYSHDKVMEYDLHTGVWLRDIVTTGSGGLDGPTDLMWASNGNLLVSSQRSNQVLEYERLSGAFVRVAAEGGGLDWPAGMLLDDGGNLLVASFHSSAVLQYSPSGEYRGEFVTGGSGGLSAAEGMAWSPNGNLLVSSRFGNEVLEYDGDDGSFVAVFAAGGIYEPTYITLMDVQGTDCNANDIYDTCDTFMSYSEDCNANSYPDECEADCNATGIPDDCDIANGTSSDINHNGIPDECECIGDIDYDNDIDIADLAQLLGSYGETSGMSYGDGDIDADGDVDIADLAELLGHYDDVCQ